MGIRGATRRPGRSIAVVGILACGVFLIVAVGANRGSGQTTASWTTGGFDFVASTSAPILGDLGDANKLAAMGVKAPAGQSPRIVSIQTQQGDDASCINLNRPQRPQLWAVPPAAMAAHARFEFVDALAGATASRGGLSAWWLLTGNESDGAVPAIVDQTTADWSLHKSLGATISYTDERGSPFLVRIVGIVRPSILQGGVIISQRHFAERFPSNSGFRMFLIAAGTSQAGAVAREFGDSVALADAGFGLTPVAARLADLHEVEDTYLSIFQVLGGLGLALGAGGVGVLLLRNTWERRGELAVLRALGYRRKALVWMVLCEHGLLVAMGLAAGVVCAGAAIAPTIATRGSSLPWTSMAATVTMIVLVATASILAASIVAMGGPVTAALRDE